MQIAVRNYRRCARADLRVSKIGLVAGLNEAGKSSLAEAVRAALLRTSIMSPHVKKADAKALVTDGQTSATIRLAGDGGSVVVALPSCEVSSEGDAPPWASSYAAGLASIPLTDPKERPAALAGYIDNGLPTKQDVANAMKDLGYSAEAVERMWKSLQAGGWDDTATKAAEHGTKLKGQWEQVSGERWGDVKAPAWKPDRFDPTWQRADLEAGIETARTAVDEALRSQGSDAARVEAERAKVAAAAELDMEGLEATLALATKQAAAARKQLDESPMPHAAPIHLDCPHCGAAAVLTIEPEKSGTRYGLALPGDHARDGTTMKQLRDKHYAAAKLERSAQEALEQARSRMAAAESVNAAGVAAEEWLDTNAADDDGGQASDRVAAARAALAQAEADLACLDRAEKAAAIVAQWARNAGMLKVLGPEGLRRTALARALAPFNERLAALSKAAGIEPVLIDEEFAVRRGHQPYWRLSASAQWLVRIVLQVAQAQIDRSSLLVIDGADIFDPRNRNGLIGLLLAGGVPALVTMTVSTPKRAPDLGKAGVGTSYWLDGGQAIALPLMTEQGVAA